MNCHECQKRIYLGPLHWLTGNCLYPGNPLLRSWILYDILEFLNTVFIQYGFNVKFLPEFYWFFFYFLILYWVYFRIFQCEMVRSGLMYLLIEVYSRLNILCWLCSSGINFTQNSWKYLWRKKKTMIAIIFNGVFYSV